MPGVLVPRAPAGLYGRLFWPGPHEVLKPGLVRLEGWLAWANGPAGPLHVHCDDKDLGSTAHLRPLRESHELPVPAELRASVQRWVSPADLTGLADGEHRLDVEVSLPEHGWVLLDSVCIIVSKSEQGGRPLGGFTNLPDGVQAPRGPITVTGVALHLDGPVRAVVLNLDRIAVARVEVGLPSPEAVKTWHELPGAKRSGWRAEIDLRAAEGKTALLTVDALTPGDEWVRLDSARIRLLDGA